MTHKRISLLGTGAIVLALVGCTPAAPGTPSPATSGPSAAAFVGTKSFTFPFSSPGISDVPLRQAFADLNAAGWDIETIDIGTPEVLAEGLAKGDFAFSTESTTSALLAAQAGAPIRIVATYARNAWTMYAATEVKTCADLDGKRVAIHSATASTTAMQNTWIAKECAGTEPEIVVLPGSPNRAAALQQGVISATALELADTVALEATDDNDEYHLLTSFAEGLPDLRPSTIYTTQKFLDENPDTVKGILRALLDVHRKIATDPAYLREITIAQYPDVAMDTLDEVVDLYTEQNIFPVNGDLTEDAIAYTIDFYTKVGVVKPGLKAADLAGLAPLNAVLDEIGRK